MDGPGTEDLIVEFLRTHDAKCPRCGYSVKGLEEGKCPECGKALELALAIKEPRVFARAWFVGFSGLVSCAGFFMYVSAYFSYAWMDSAGWVVLWPDVGLPVCLFVLNLAIVLAWCRFARRNARLGNLVRWAVSICALLIAVATVVSYFLIVL